MAYFGPGGKPLDPREPEQGWVEPPPHATGAWRDETASMDLDEAFLVVTSQDPQHDPQSQLAASLAVRSLADLTMCSICGSPVIHPPTHMRWHFAVATVAKAARDAERDALSATGEGQ